MVFCGTVSKLSNINLLNILVVTREPIYTEHYHTVQNYFCNPILFAICTSTFSKLCKNIYTVACRIT
jgi:hypothetical protein